MTVQKEKYWMTLTAGLGMLLVSIGLLSGGYAFDWPNGLNTVGVLMFGLGLSVTLIVLVLGPKQPGRRNQADGVSVTPIGVGYDGGGDGGC